MEKQNISYPKYLYKVISREQWEESQFDEHIMLTDLDTDFIHLAKEDQVDHVLQKFWKNEDCVILKLISRKLNGLLLYETNEGGTNRYYHLYEGNIPFEAIIDVSFHSREILENNDDLSEFRKIETDKAPKVIGPYSQAVGVYDLVFISGQIPIEPLSGIILDHTIEGQTKQVLDNIEAILNSDGLTLQNVIKTEIYVVDLNDYQIINLIYAERFSFPIKPARQMVQVSALPLNSLIEISCTAIKTQLVP